MKDHAIANNVRSIAMPKNACGLDKKDWDEHEFQHSGITIFVYASGHEIKETPALQVFDTENVSKTFD